MSTPFQVLVHPRIPSLSDPHRFLQAYQRGDRNAPNTLIILGGLTSGPHTTDLDFLADALTSQHSALGYSLWELRTRSAYTGFGHSSLANDAEDVSDLVRYLRTSTTTPKGKIVLMGSSTGSQACLQHAKSNPQHDTAVDGYILTSPVSDREFAPLIMAPEALAESLRVAREMMADGKAQDSMPRALMPFVFAEVPVSAYRWWSLADVGGDDDFFSSDLSDAELAERFGRVDKPLLILPAGEDELVPGTVDREGLMARWVAACREGVVSELSGFIPGAGHEVEEGRAREWMVERVVRFLGGL